MLDPYSFSSMICSSTGGAWAFAAAFLAEAFFSFFFSFQLSTLFFQMGFPDSSFSSAVRVEISVLPQHQKKEMVH